MSSNIQFVKEAAAAVPNATAANKSRVFQDTADNIFKTKDNLGNILPISGVQSFSWTVVGPITNGTSPYTVLVPFETVRVDPSGGQVDINLITAVGNAGRQIKVKNTTASPNPIVIDAFGAETIDGNLTWTMITPREFAVLESDGANWMIVG